MSEQTLSFIEPVKSFKYSVNIKLDMGDFDKINSFIPTAKNTRLFEELYQSFYDESVTRSHILIGAYGTGKSFFATILATLLSDKSKDKYKTFLQNIADINKNLANKFKDELADKKPYLIVLPSTDGNSFKQSMLIGLQKALKKNGLEDIFPETYFESIIRKIEQWKVEYIETFNNFKYKLENDIGESIDQYYEKLRSFDRDSYNYFINIYPELTSGGEFNKFYDSSLNDIYEKVTYEIKKLGYQGVYVIFDEFNRLLEDDIETLDGKIVQDFSEMASRSAENEIHLLLISHKRLLQYASNLTRKRVDEWKKIEGRFRTLDASEYSSQVYELMSTVLKKEKLAWKSYKKKQKEKFNFYLDKVKNLNICPNYGDEELNKYLIYGCYPMHPLTAILLPKLAQKVAQNERTVFTFLSTDEENTLGDFINTKHEDEFPVNYPSNIYNYFENLMKQEIDFTNVHQAWADTQRALQKVKTKEEIEVIKTLGVINAVNLFSELPPSKDILSFSVDYLSKKEFEKVTDKLIKNKVLLYRKSIDEFRFFEGSELDFHKLMEEKKAEVEHSFSGLYLLNDYFKPSPVIAKRYNDQYNVIRYFLNEYMYLNDFENVSDWEKYLNKYNNKSYIDGIVVYLVLNTKEKIKKATELVSNISSERVIFVIPKKPLEVNDLLADLDAQRELLKDQELLKKDSLAKKEITAYLEETTELLENKLEKYINPSNHNAYYYYKSKRLTDIHNRRDLLEKVSKICFDVFSNTPIINNELIVKNDITTVQKSARKEVVEKIIFSSLNKRLDITGYGPPFLIYRTILITTNLLIKNDEDSLVFNPSLIDIDAIGEYPEVNENLYNVLREIIDSVYNNDGVTKMGSIYNKLRCPPYGLRLGIIPILLALAGRINSSLKYAIIRHNNEEKEINAELFEEINQHPDRYEIDIKRYNRLQKDYLNYIEEIYKDYFNEQSYNEVNRNKKIYYSIRKWYQSLPKYARETNFVSDQTKLLRKIITARTLEINKLILDVIPHKLLGAKLENKEQLEKLKKYFKKFFTEENQAIVLLQAKVVNELNALFGGDGSLGNRLKNWYRNLSEKAKINTYSNESNAFLSVLRRIMTNMIDDEKIIKELSLITTGFEFKDWNDKIYTEFINKIKDIKEQIEGYSSNNDTSKKSSNKFVIYDSEGKKYQRSFEDVKLDGLSKILENKIRSSFNDIGSSVSDLDKQQILINILKEMFEE